MTWRYGDVIGSDCVRKIERSTEYESDEEGPHRVAGGRMLLSGNWPPFDGSDEKGLSGGHLPDIPGTEESLELSKEWDDPPSSVNSSEDDITDEDSIDDVKVALLVNVPPLMVVPEPTTQEEKQPSPQCPKESFTALRITYLLVTLVIMLADGLQGAC